MAITYVGLMFWHAGLEGDSWDYLWATVAVWLASILARAFWYNRVLVIKQNLRLAGSAAHLTSLAGGMTKIDMVAPKGFHWRPSQHCFLRFPEISLFDSHPFTIANADKCGSGSHYADQVQNISFLVRSHAGFTRSLSHYLQEKPDSQLQAWIDGPYGGVSQVVEKSFDTVVLVAGGSGISACLPWLEHLLSRIQCDKHSGRSKISHLKLVWAVREQAHLDWVIEEVKTMSTSATKGCFELELHITGAAADDAGIVTELIPLGDIEQRSPKDLGHTAGKATDDLPQVTTATQPVQGGRPQMNMILASLAKGARVMVIGKCLLMWVENSYRSKQLTLTKDVDQRALKLTCQTRVQEHK